MQGERRKVVCWENVSLLQFYKAYTHPLESHLFSSVQFNRSVMSDSLRPHGLQHPGFPVHHQLLEFTQTHVH